MRRAIFPPEEASKWIELMTQASEGSAIMRAAETGSAARAKRDVRNREELVSLLSTIAGTEPTLCGKTRNSYSAAGGMQASRIQTRGVTGLKSYVGMSQDSGPSQNKQFVGTIH